ncbi:hypothetical protein D3C85_1870110 [compost metagenome]
MAPEGRPPGMVKLIETAIIFNFKPFTESILTEITVAFAAELIGNVPADDRRMIRITLCQLGVNQRCLFPVDR